MTVTCFWLEPGDVARIALRRYQAAAHGDCPLPPGYHSAITGLADVPVTWVDEVPDGVATSFADLRYGGRKHGIVTWDWPPSADPAWPAACACGYQFTRDDPHQKWTELLWRRADTGELVTLRDAPDGAMWDATWLHDWAHGPDGRSLVVKCPGGHEWTIDGRASNCTMPDDQVHKCWVRHGEPPRITVDKNGATCAAGAGSIQAGSYHGFLRDGVFT